MTPCDFFSYNKWKTVNYRKMASLALETGDPEFDRISGSYFR